MSIFLFRKRFAILDIVNSKNGYDGELIMERILVVEDDLALSTGLCFELDAAGYVTQEIGRAHV